MRMLFFGELPPTPVTVLLPLPLLPVRLKRGGTRKCPACCCCCCCKGSDRPCSEVVPAPNEMDVVKDDEPAAAEAEEEEEEEEEVASGAPSE